MQQSASIKNPNPGPTRDGPTSSITKTSSAPYASIGNADSFDGSPPNTSINFTTSPSASRRSLERNVASTLAPGVDKDRSPEGVDGVNSQFSTLLVRKLPASTTHEALISMLLFADDFLEARLTQDYPDDHGLLSAIARFRTFESAIDVRDRLNGKPNAAQDATMVVEVLHKGSNVSSGSRRRSSDAHPNRQLSASVSSAGSGAASGGRHSSRYNNTFQSMDKISPSRRSQGQGSIDLPNSDVSSHLQSIFSPQSPIGTSIGERTRATGKSVISDDAIDDDTGEILKDPLAYAKSGQLSGNQWHTGSMSMSLRNLKLDTGPDGYADVNSMMSPPGSGFGHNARQIPPPLKSPNSEFAPNGLANGMTPMSPQASYPLSPQNFGRHQYPPANPADQNPPCNTLYVGNLPIDTSEDELKAMFSKQRGYKRLCFRTKHNGPMCFVEFEDISFATKALNELYGQPLHNSVKGGIRLSFSKNPLGVRTGQGNGLGPTSPLTSPNASGFGNVACPPGFSTANGPPPGLPMPAPNITSATSSGSSNFFLPGSPPLTSTTSHSGFARQPMSANYPGNAPGMSGLHSVGTGFSDFPMGR